MGNTGRLVDENPQNGVLACAFKFRINELIPLAFNNFLNEPPQLVPFDSHTHHNKKVGETPTPRFFLSIGFGEG
jgi:hypothetical protein